MTYLKFLNLTADITLTCDATAQRVLDRIATPAEPLTVMQAMAFSDLASPATIHRKIDDLMNAGLVEMIHKDNNRRTKYLVPTKLANHYFAKLSAAMVKAGGAK